MKNPTYLGDAVYAKHVGYGIELILNDHRNQPALFLELPVLDALNRFNQQIQQEQ